MRKERNHKGFTLIEMVVVIAIMGIMMGIGSYSLSLIASANAKECTHEINAALVSTRTKAYSSDSGTSVATMTLKKGTDGSIYVDKSFEDEKKVGGSKVAVSYSADGSTYTELDNAGLTFSFNRSSGAFNALPCKYIKVASGTKTYIITCYKNTGKTMVE